ncbi:hypothetical protein [Azospirillum endophyticum]
MKIEMMWFARYPADGRGDPQWEKKTVLFPEKVGARSIGGFGGLMAAHNDIQVLLAAPARKHGECQPPPVGGPI